MKTSSGPVFICHGFNKFFDVPKATGGRHMALRTAVVIKKRDFFDEWDVYDSLFWLMLKSVADKISDKMRIKAFGCGSRTFDTLDELRIWQTQQKSFDPEFDLEPPCEIEFFSEGYLVSLMRFENWSDIVKHEPYACSFTFSFYSDNMKINAWIGEGLQDFLSANSEISNVTHVHEEPAPKWYWPVMERLKSDKFQVYGMFGLAALFFAVVALMSPSPSKANKIAHCRRFLQKARFVLLAIDDNPMDMTFFEWLENKGKTQTSGSLASEICEYCNEYSRLSGRKYFRIKLINGHNLLTDPWGRPYNVEMLRSFHDADIRTGLKGHTVGGIVMWSSGPNGINEHGEGDDIFELPRNKW